MGTSHMPKWAMVAAILMALAAFLIFAYLGARKLHIATDPVYAEERQYAY
jgi:hypothetical protein